VAVRLLIPWAPSRTLPCNVIDRCPGSREIVTDTLTSFVEPCVSVRDVSVTSLVDETRQGYRTISDTLNPSLMVVSGLGVSDSGQPVMTSLAMPIEENGSWALSRGGVIRVVKATYRCKKRHMQATIRSAVQTRKA
jgi:hypothetical protein